MDDNAAFWGALVRTEAQLGHGPLPGWGASHGRPFNGVVEMTPVLWVTWLTYTARRIGREMPMAIKVRGEVVEIVSVELTFGRRHFFRCPRCGHRREALYFLGERCGCRVCLHLGYQSQCSRATSAWPELDRLFGRAAAGRRWPRKGGAVVLDVHKLRAQLRKGIEEMLSQVQVVEGADATSRADLSLDSAETEESAALRADSTILAIERLDAEIQGVRR